MPLFPSYVCRHLHFQKLNNICHFSDHLTNLSMSSCSFCLSPMNLVFLNSLVSSANCNMLPVTPSSKSFMYIKPLHYVYVIDTHVNWDYSETQPMEDACRIQMRRDRRWWQKARFERAIHSYHLRWCEQKIVILTSHATTHRCMLCCWPITPNPSGRSKRTSQSCYCTFGDIHRCLSRIHLCLQQRQMPSRKCVNEERIANAIHDL